MEIVKLVGAFSALVALSGLSAVLVYLLLSKLGDWWDHLPIAIQTLRKDPEFPSGRTLLIEAAYLLAAISVLITVSVYTGNFVYGTAAGMLLPIIRTIVREAHKKLIIQTGSR